MARMADLGGPLFVDVDGLRIRYVRSPRGDGTTPAVSLSPFPESLYAQTRSGRTSTCRAA